VPGSQNNSGREAPEIDLSQFSERKQSLYRRLTNAEVWPNRARECLQRYSPARVEANFELFRKRAPEIDDHGAWLCAAITDGYADCTTRSEGGQADENPGPEPSKATRTEPGSSPDHKQKVTAEEKRTFIRTCTGVKPDHFHRYRHAESQTEKQFLYFDPEIGGPTGRGNPTGRAGTPSSAKDAVSKNCPRTSSP
jgi:hypothetical protein